MAPYCMGLPVMRKEPRQPRESAMTRTIDTHTHVLADDTIKLLQKEIPSLGLKMTPIDADNAVLEVAGVPVPAVSARRP